MAEAKRRSDVKKFAHRTAYPPDPLPLQTSLFEDATLNTDRDWNCTNITSTIPAIGSTVLVRVGSAKRLEVLWGNQIVAEITDPLGSELSMVLCDSGRDGGVVATIVPSDKAQNQSTIRISRDIR